MIEEALYLLLKNNSGVSTIVSTKIYPLAAPQTVSIPFVVYECTQTEREHSLSGPSLLAYATFNIHCYQTTHAKAKALAKAVRKAVEGYRGNASKGTGTVRIFDIACNTELDSLEGETDPKLYNVMLEITITYREE